jgi:hypothetical protein
MGRFARAPHSLATSTRGNPRRFTTAGVFLTKWSRYFFTSGHSLDAKGLTASSAEIVAIRL